MITTDTQTAIGSIRAEFEKRLRETDGGEWKVELDADEYFYIFICENVQEGFRFRRRTHTCFEIEKNLVWNATLEKSLTDMLSWWNRVRPMTLSEARERVALIAEHKAESRLATTMERSLWLEFIAKVSETAPTPRLHTRYCRSRTSNLTVAAFHRP